MGNCNGKNAAKSSDTAVEPGRPSELTHMKKEELKKVLDADSVKREVSLLVEIVYHRCTFL